MQDQYSLSLRSALDVHPHTDLHACPPHPRGLTDLATGELSSICAGTAPPCGSRAGTCRPTERGVWPVEHPVCRGTRQPPAPPVGTLMHRLHTAPGPGTTPRTEDRRSTPDELQHSQWGREGRGNWVLRMATHLQEDKRDGGRRVKRERREREALTGNTLIVVNILTRYQSTKLQTIKNPTLKQPAIYLATIKYVCHRFLSTVLFTCLWHFVHHCTPLGSIKSYLRGKIKHPKLTSSLTA